MTKRPDKFDVVELYKAILADYLAIYPTDQHEVDRDTKRLTLAFRSRGLAFFTLDLPDLGKDLDRSLDQGLLAFPPGRHYAAPRWKGSPIPRLFSGLWIRLFQRNGLLREDIDPNVVLLLRTLLYTCKKLRVECKPKRLFEATKEYFDVDSQIHNVPGGAFSRDEFLDRPRNGRLEARSLLNGERFLSLDQGVDRLFAREGANPLDVSILDCLSRALRYAGVLVSTLGYLSPESIRGRHGPGAVSEGLHREQKFLFPQWSPRLEAIFPSDIHGRSSWTSGLTDDGYATYPSNIEGSSKLHAVPKTQKTPRLIAMEPTANQWIQQGVSDWLRRRVAATPLGISIDFFDQEPSRQAALAASRDGLMATVDLSSASDRLSCDLVEAVFQANFSLLRALSACRTRFLRNPLDNKMPSLIRLNKFASMGSALTFPVQSIVFAVLAVGVGSHLNPKLSLRALLRKVRVFGDDIVLPSTWVEPLSRLFAAVGLKVNESKTYSTGRFRESCGMDAWNGFDVTPAYIRWPSAELVSRSAVGYVAVSNNFFLKGFWHTAAWLDKAASWTRKLPAVQCRAAVFGRVTFCSGPDPSLARAWDSETQQEGCRVFQVFTRKATTTLLDDHPDPFLDWYVNHSRSRRGWQDVLFPTEQSLSVGEQILAIGRDVPVIIRRGWVPLAVLSAA